MRDMLKSRMREINDNILNRAGWFAFGHIATAALVAGLIAFATAQTNQIGWLWRHRPVWYAVTSILPLALSGAISLLWHRFGSAWLEENALRGWILHAFYNPRRGHMRLNLPSPETYLVIAAAASAGAVLTLSMQPWIIKTVTATIVGASTAAVIVIASPNVGAVAVRGKLNWQTEQYYQRLLTQKSETQQSALRRQNFRCYDCGDGIRHSDRRFAFINEENIPEGRLSSHDIKAVCRRCSRVQPTTDEVRL